MAAQNKKPRELTGWHVLIMLIVFFGIIIAVNIYFITAAVSSFRGEDVKGSYRQGLEYNETIAQRETQSELGWNISANVTSQADGSAYIIIAALDKNSLPLNGLAFEAVLRHPTDLKEDRPIALIPMGEGKYKSALDMNEGSWQLRATAQSGEQAFRFQHSFRLP